MCDSSSVRDKRNIENLLTTYNLQHISVVDWLNK